MTIRRTLTDAQIRAALSIPSGVQAPYGLADEIMWIVDATPQRRRGLTMGTLLSGPQSAIRVMALAALLGLLLVAGLAIAGAFRPAPTPEPPPSDSAMFRGGPGRTGVVAGPGPVTQPTAIWEQDLDGGVAANSPAVVDGVLYIGDQGGSVSAFRASTGDRLWKTALRSAVNTSPAVASGLVVVGDAAGDVVALDVSDGQVRWTFRTGGELRSSALIVGDVVYVGSADGNLYALELMTGAQRWAFSAGGPINRSPAIDRGVIYVGADAGMFSAVDATSGDLLWQASLGAGQLSSPAVADGLVVVSSGLDTAAPHALFGFDAASGEERWRFSAPSGQLLIIEALGRDLVYAASADGELYAVNTTTGLTEWTFDGHGTLGAAGALAGNLLFVSGGDRAVYAVDAETGVQRWRTPVTGDPGALAVVGERVYLATSLGKVVALGSAP